MSYILDALKKAESERNLGAVPTLHATASNNARPVEGQASWRKALPWLLVLLMAGILLLALLWLHPWSKATDKGTDQAAISSASTPSGESVAAIAPNVNAPNHAPPLVQAPAQPIVQPILRPAASTPQAVKPIPAPVVATSKTEKPVQPSAKKPNAEAPPAGQSPPAATAAPQPPPQDAAKLEEEKIGTVQDLPPNIQRELPQVSVNGYIYAKNPLDRSVLINKRLLHEGDTIAPDLLLEKMTPKGAILNFKGYRYRISF
jgi:general secretion pathway protein B